MSEAAESFELEKIRFALSGDEACPLISVCIANYNGTALIVACIESVLAQKVEGDVEILVHDDASTDDSAAIVERDYPSVSLIRAVSNVGFCVANNRMVAAARGEFILLLNNDAELLPDALAVFLAAARLLKSPTVLSLPQYDHATGALIDRGCMLDPFFNPVPNQDINRQNVAMVIGACLWIPKDSWLKLGGFPEWIESIGEDLYLCCRARLAGISVRVLTESGYLHRVGASFGGGKPVGAKLVTTFRRRALSERNKTFVMVTTCPAPFMQILLPLHLLLMLIEGVLVTVLSGRLAFLMDIYLPAIYMVMRRLLFFIDVRAKIMKHKRLASADFFTVFDPVPYKLRMLVRHGFPIVQ